MAYRKKTLRQMSPTARKVARLTGELESIARRLKNLTPDLQRLDLDSASLSHANSGLTLSDADAWGLQSALLHGLQDGYLKENQEWAEAIIKRIDRFREK